MGHIVCDCGKVLAHVYGNGVYNFMAECRIVDNRRLCVRCADDRENMREMGYEGYSAPPQPVTMDKSGEGARRMQRRLEQLPIVRHDETTFLTDLGRAKVMDPLWAVEIITAHALASNDVNGWLDALNSPASTEEERAHALERLTHTAEEYRWLCDKREQVDEKMQAAADGKNITVTWRKS